MPIRPLFRTLLAGGLLAMLLAGPAAGGEDMGTFGAPDAPGVTLMAALTPTVLDKRGLLRPALRHWLSQVAARSGTRLTVRPVLAERPLTEIMRDPDACTLGYARLPAREDSVHWLAEIRRDRLVFIARRDDTFQGSLAEFLRAADGQVAAPSGIYRTILDHRGIKHSVVDDQRVLARMVADGHPRFGLLIGNAMNAPEVRALSIRTVAELPELGLWFACSRTMADGTVNSLRAAMPEADMQRLRRELLIQDEVTE